MFEDIMCLLGGFLTSYLIIRAVRSFRGGVGLWLCVSVGSAGTVLGGSVTAHLTKTGTCEARYRFQTWSGASWTGSLSGLVPGDPQYSGSGTKDCRLLFKIGSTPLADGSDASVIESWTANLDANEVHNYDFSCSGSVTNYVKCFPAWTNTASCSVVLRLQILDGNGAVVDDLSTAPMVPGDVWPARCLTNALGQGVPYSVKLERSGCQEDDYVPVVLVEGPATGNVNSGGVTPTPPTNNTINNPPPIAGDDTNRTDRTMENSQLDAIRRALGDLAGKVSTWPKQDTQTGLLGQIATNTVSSGAPSVLTNQLDELRQIKTNTFNTAANVLDFATNANAFFGSMNTNMGVLLTNTDSPTFDGLSNGVALAMAAGNAASNLFQGEFQREGGEADWGTNGMNGGWVNGAGPSRPGANPMAVTIGTVGGVTHVVNFSIFRSAQWLSQKLLTVMPWVRKWLAWAIALTLFMLCADRMDEIIRQMYMGAQISVKPAGGGSVKLYGLRVTSLIYMVGITITLLAIVPTALLAWLHSAGVENPLSATAFMDDIVNIGDSWFVQIVQEYLATLLLMVPIDVVGTAIFTWVSFYFTARFWLRIGLEAVRWLGFVIPCLMLLALPVAGAQLRFENLSGSPVVASNSYEVVTLPVGVTDLNLSAGTWAVGSTNGFTVGSDGYQVVRAWGDTNAPGIVVLSQWQGYSSYGWFVMGMNLGLVVFGTAWAISAARSGILLRVRE